MPIDYWIDAGCGLIFTTAAGTLRAREVVQHIEALHAADALALPELIDARAALTPSLSSEDVWQIAAAAASFKGRVRFGPRAIVVDDSMAFALSRMFAILVTPFLSAKVFSNLPEAESWLTDAALTR